MSKFGSAHTNPNTTWTGQLFAEQKLGTGYLTIQDRNKSHYRIHTATQPRKSIGGKSYPPAHKRDWRAGEFQRQDKEITFQKQARDPATGEFTTTGQKVVRHKYYRPPDPNTEAQQARRAVFSAGVIAAQALTPLQKAEWILLAQTYTAQTWFSLFMRAHLKTH